jgi:hypothetical protein
VGKHDLNNSKEDNTMNELTYFNDATKLVNALKEADKYGMSMEFLAEFLTNVQHQNKSVDAAIEQALMEWDI